MRVLLLIACLVVSVPAWAQTVLPSTPTRTERLDQVLMIGSISMSSIALGLTMSCTSDGTCRELNPVMNRFIGDSPVTAVVVKSAVVGGATYAVWHTMRGKKRTFTLAAMFAINALDAVHDIRQSREIQRRGQ